MLQLKKIPGLSLLAVLLCMTFNSHAQGGGVIDTAGVVRTQNDLKTGNYLDLLTNFFQLAAQDLGGADKSFQFKSTLYGIMSRGDETLLVDTNFNRLRHAQNLQFEVAVHTNQNFKLSGISGGITYAIINNRNRGLANFRNTSYDYEDDLFKERAKALDNAYLQTLLALPEDQRNEALKAFTAGQTHFMQTGETDQLPEPLKAAYEKEALSLQRQKVYASYDSLMEYTASRGLLTAALTARTDSASRKFSEARLRLAYLKGMGGRRIEADIRADLNYKDTLTPDNHYRTDVHVVAGANIIVLQSKKKHKSLLEIKPNLEFQSILSKQYPGQDNYFSFNMDVRLRITDKIWLPVIVKYDLVNQNFLGFLNVSVNLDAFKGFLSNGG